MSNTMNLTLDENWPVKSLGVVKLLNCDMDEDLLRIHV
jgi:hypothetical protein